MSSKSGRTTRQLTGTCVSHGTAAGYVVCLFGRKRQFFRGQIESSDVAIERNRFSNAVEATARALQSLIDDPTLQKSGAAAIFDAHLLILESSSFAEAISETIESDLVTAEWAVKLVCDELIARQRAVADAHIRARYGDIEDVSERLLDILGGSNDNDRGLPPDTVLVGTEIRPSTLIEFRNSPPVAIVTEHGGWTSHTFILAREMGIPAVSGVKRAIRHLNTGDKVLVDADAGLIIPDDGRERLDGPSRRDPLQSVDAIGTTDTFETSENYSPRRSDILIRVNLDDPARYAAAEASGANGIGLLRSEYLFPGVKGWPSEVSQLRAYRAVSEAVGTAGARIRTFDFGIDQISFGGNAAEKNPALGMRGVRLGLTNDIHFRTQLRSILRANTANNLSIVLPMVSSVSEVIRARSIIDDEIDKLHANGESCLEPQVGAMIELPSAVLMIDSILEHVSFICVGTNDLVQYTLGVDRDNGSVADWYRSLDPSIVRSLRIVIEAAKRANTPASVCGEMAGSSFYTPIFLGLGVTELSMMPATVKNIRRILMQIDSTDAGHLLEEVEKLQTADEVESFLSDAYARLWPNIKFS